MPPHYLQLTRKLSCRALRRKLEPPPSPQRKLGPSASLQLPLAADNLFDKLPQRDPTRRTRITTCPSSMLPYYLQLTRKLGGSTT